MDHLEQMKEMIHREIQSIEGLRERAAFKEMMEGVFLALYETNEKMYKRLESRVMDELAYDINRYQIKTGLVEQAYLDQSHHFMNAVCEEDMEKRAYKAADLRKKIESQGKACLTTVFVQCDVLKLKDFYKNQDSFTGVLYAEKEYPVPVKAEMAKRYLSEIEHLYHLFMKNGVPWKTINAPYFFKMADICIAGIPEGIPDEALVTGLGVDFGDYNQYIHYDMIPIWNIRRLKLESVGFPVACEDHENYEHTISVHQYGAEHAYLVEDKSGIRHIRQNGDRLLITGKVANAKKWDVYMIRNGREYKIDRYTYPVMENFRKDGFSERFRIRTGQPVKTTGELRRFILGFGLEDYIEYQDCGLKGPGSGTGETYPMNFFMREEVREQKGKRLLLLYFKPKSQKEWLLRDLASFISSEVQELYPEYQCEGVLL